ALLTIRFCFDLRCLIRRQSPSPIAGARRTPGTAPLHRARQFLFQSSLPLFPTSCSRACTRRRRDVDSQPALLASRPGPVGSRQSPSGNFLSPLPPVDLALSRV
ncbi:hypothetical protein HAX54_045599, partial [Datura stramonium]|nr:hypothetical protein [Datura stramonium]